jgi:FKBP-type peptidyl-prolyl cis-trans isomerase (trigger factor)
MANSQNFRSAFNGFNREDVVHYLEYLNSKHNNLVNQLSEEAENLRQKVTLAAEAVAADSSRAEQIVALENLEATKEDIAEAVAVIARQNRMTVEQLKPYYDAEFEAAVVRSVLSSKAMKLVRDEADVILA